MNAKTLSLLFGHLSVPDPARSLGPPLVLEALGMVPGLGWLLTSTALQLGLAFANRNPTEFGIPAFLD
jgi:hypothetical protein